MHVWYLSQCCSVVKAIHYNAVYMPDCEAKSSLMPLHINHIQATAEWPHDRSFISGKTLPISSQTPYGPQIAFVRIVADLNLVVW